MFDSIDIICDHSDHLQVKVERYRPVQVIKSVYWLLYEMCYPSYYHVDDLNGSIPFHFYLQMVGMIRYDIYAIKHKLKKYLNAFEMIFLHFKIVLTHIKDFSNPDFCRFDEKFAILARMRSLISKISPPYDLICIETCQVGCQLSPDSFMDLWRHLGAEKSIF